MFRNVIIDNKGDKIYHDVDNPSCLDHGLNNDPKSKETISEITAIERGYKKCGNCFEKFDPSKTYQ